MSEKILDEVIGIVPAIEAVAKEAEQLGTAGEDWPTRFSQIEAVLSGLVDVVHTAVKSPVLAESSLEGAVTTHAGMITDTIAFLHHIFPPSSVGPTASGLLPPIPVLTKPLISPAVKEPV